MTKYESKIYDIINASYDHMTSEEVFFKLRETEPKVVLATVYNNLNRLYADGYIIKLSIPGQPDRYDKKIRHDHLVCCECKKISDFTYDDLTADLEKSTGYKILGYDLQISYICKECSEKKNS